MRVIFRDPFGLYLYDGYRGCYPYRCYGYRNRYLGLEYESLYPQLGYWYVPEDYAYLADEYECHPVYKRGYYRGYPVLISATMCYDDYGRPYIRGRRRVVEYL